MEECKCKPAKSLAERVIDYKEFVSLVRRMREAQREWLNINTCEDEETEDVLSRMIQYESEVDECLEKMEI